MNFSPFVRDSLREPTYAVRYHRSRSNAFQWSSPRLQKHYKAEYDSLRRCKREAKAGRIRFDDNLADLVEWLMHLGPRPAAGWTVQRIKSDKGYQPGNLKWVASTVKAKPLQVCEHHVVKGKVLTTREFAEFLDASYGTVCQRIKSGWTTERLLREKYCRIGINSWTFWRNRVQGLELMYEERKSRTQSRIDWLIASRRKLFGKMARLFPSKNEMEDEAQAEQRELEAKRDALKKEQREMEAFERRFLAGKPPIPKRHRATS